MAKKAAAKPRESQPTETLAKYLCRTQGIGKKLAESVVAKLPAEQRKKAEDLVAKGASPQEVMNVLGPQPEPPKQNPDTPSDTKDES